MVCMVGGIRALSAQPGLSIYTQLVAKTLSFHLFALRIKQPHRATGFVSHCRQCCKPASRPIHTANIDINGPITTLVSNLNNNGKCYTGTPLISLYNFSYLT